MKGALAVVAAAAVVALGSAAIAKDKVASLPGYGALPTDTYSGLLDVGQGKALHYLFYSSRGSTSDPVIIWFNGGPGCSSLEGAFAESGPFWVSPGGASLQDNAYTWNNFSHHLFLEAPACVGFSTASTTAGCTHNDTGTAIDNLAAVVAFFKGFPEYQGNDFWITGESYAGIYIPTLAYNIVNHNAAGSLPTINLKGIIVGNGCLGDEVGICGSDAYGDYLEVAQLHGHGFISDKAFNAVTKACTDYNNPTAACENALQAADDEAGNNFDVYDIYSAAWGICPYGAMKGLPPRKRTRPAAARRPVKEGSRMARRLAASDGANSCSSEEDLTTYMNRADVQAALHVTMPDGGWSLCASIDYTPNIADETQVIYPALLAAGLDVWILNGEADACVPITDNQYWTDNFAVKQKMGTKKPWTAWTASDGNLGGYITQYAPATGNFSFITVRLAGHMVPQTQPLYSHDLVHRVVNGLPF